MMKTNNGYINKEFNRNYKKIPESSNIVLECRMVKTTVSQATDEILGKYKAFTPKNKNMWSDDIKVMYNRKIRKIHHKSWEQFQSHLESDI